MNDLNLLIFLGCCCKKEKGCKSRGENENENGSENESENENENGSENENESESENENECSETETETQNLVPGTYVLPGGTSIVVKAPKNSLRKQAKPANTQPKIIPQTTDAAGKQASDHQKQFTVVISTPGSAKQAAVTSDANTNELQMTTVKGNKPVFKHLVTKHSVKFPKPFEKKQ